MIKITNSNNEILDYSLDGDLDSASIIILYNHGFGTDKHERGLSDDIVSKLTSNYKELAILRFSYAGYGKSEGKQEEKTLDTMADDLISVWDFIENNKSKNSLLRTISFSLGNQVLTKAYAKKKPLFDKIICVNPARFSTGQESKEKWCSRPGVKEENGVMFIPRADGSITKIGEAFWNSIDPEAYKRTLEEIANNFDSTLIRATEDHIVDNEELTSLSFKKIIEIPGDHNFSKLEDKEVFLNKLAEVISS